MKPYDWQQDPEVVADFQRVRIKSFEFYFTNPGFVAIPQEPKDLDLRGQPLPETPVDCPRPLNQGTAEGKHVAFAPSNARAPEGPPVGGLAPRPRNPEVPRAPHWDPDYPGFD